MITTVRDDTRPLTRLYDDVLTSVNPPNVFHKVEVRMQEPFQPSSRYPIAEPPVRYPDLTTIPGFLENPMEDAVDVRYQAGRLAQRVADNTSAENPLGRPPVGWETYGDIAYQKDKTGSLPSSERVERIVYPYAPLRGTYPMEGWEY